MRQPHQYLCAKESVPTIICQKTFKGEASPTAFSTNQCPQKLEIDTGLLVVLDEDKHQAERELASVFVLL